MLSEQNVKSLAAPFTFEEHGFKNGQVYIRKSAIRRRLSKVDLLWSMSAPEYVGTFGDDQDVIMYRGSITVHGVTRWGLGNGIVQRGADDKKAEGFTLAKNVAHAHKQAATDIVARAALEFGIGNYLKDKPSNIKQDGFKEWLAKLTPPPAPLTTQQPPVQPTTGSNPTSSTPPAAPIATWATAAVIETLLKNAESSLFVTREEISRYTSITDLGNVVEWNTRYATRPDAAEAIRAGVKAENEKLKQATPKKETAAAATT